MTMQKFLLALAALACAILPTACSSNLSDSSSFFTPVEKSNLRLPSVPILVSDPFFSIWSPSDGLMKVLNIGAQPRSLSSAPSVLTVPYTASLAKTTSI